MDNLYPNFGAPYIPTEPIAQAVAREEEIKDTLAAIPLLEETIKHLDERIAFYESVNSVEPGAMTKPEEFMHIIAGNRIARDNLMIERSYIIGRIQRAQKK